MKLEELKAALESEKSKENEKLKIEAKEHRTKIAGLIDDCRGLTNRCYAFTRGTMCIFCRLSTYQCSHKAKLAPFKDKENDK